MFGNLAVRPVGVMGESSDATSLSEGDFAAASFPGGERIVEEVIVIVIVLVCKGKVGRWNIARRVIRQEEMGC